MPAVVSPAQLGRRRTGNEAMWRRFGPNNTLRRRPLPTVLKPLTFGHEFGHLKHHVLN